MAGALGTTQARILRESLGFEGFFRLVICEKPMCITIGLEHNETGIFIPHENQYEDHKHHNSKHNLDRGREG